MINGHQILLRPPLEKDEKFFFNLRNDVNLQMTLISRPRANSIQKVMAWLEKRLADENTLFFVIAEKQKDDAAGFIQLTNIDLINRTAQLGICLGKEYLGAGYAQESLQLLEEYANSIFNIRKILLEVLASNERAIKLYIKSGYEKTGLWKEHVYQSGKFYDVVLMEKFI